MNALPSFCEKNVRKTRNILKNRSKTVRKPSEKHDDFVTIKRSVHEPRQLHWIFDPLLYGLGFLCFHAIAVFCKKAAVSPERSVVRERMNALLHYPLDSLTLLKYYSYYTRSQSWKESISAHDLPVPGHPRIISISPQLLVAGRSYL